METNDLIYEGIATSVARIFRRLLSCETNDLIYEGIATACCNHCDSFCAKQTTWFTKGLRRRRIILELTSNHWNKRPDLRRDCDNGQPFRCVAVISMKQTTWFTKGLRLNWLGNLFYCHGWNKRPDLRRDCDFFISLPSLLKTLTKQTTWFTKGLRRFRDNSISMIRAKETNDLIYEGIATRAVKFCFDSAGVLKQTTWFTKGLRRTRLW